MNQWDDQERGLKLLMNCKNELEAQEIRATLENAGIPAFVFEKGALGLSMSDEQARFGGVQVQVPAGRVEEARSALALVEADAARIDWNEVDVGETPAEVTEVLATRDRLLAFRRVVTLVGPIVGILVLVLAVVGIIVILSS